MTTAINGFAMVMGTPSKKWEYERQANGESQRSDRRKRDEAGHELSGVQVVTQLPLVGLCIATLLAPDSQLAAVEAGSLVTFADARAVVRPADFGQVKVALTVEILTPVGDGVAALEAQAKRGGKSAA